MKRLAPVFLMLFFFSPPVYADEFQDGMNAYNQKDYQTALAKFKPLAEQGNGQAQYQLGLMYGMSLGVPKDFKEAVKWSKLSADQGYAKGQYNLGVFYARGWGVVKDEKEAIKWWTLAAEQGNANSQFDLGEMYRAGHGVDQDNVQAHKWYSIAGANGINSGYKLRDRVEKNMTPDQIAEARKQTNEWIEKHPKK